MPEARSLAALSPASFRVAKGYVLPSAWFAPDKFVLKRILGYKIRELTCPPFLRLLTLTCERATAVFAPTRRKIAAVAHSHRV